jgi:lambda repressor-like predicted transcriptional regulator
VTRDKREDYIYSRAYELAATGLHLEPITIIAALIKEGYPEAAELLDSPLIRNDLRQVCARNWPGADPERPADAIGRPAPRKRRRKPPSNASPEE